MRSFRLVRCLLVWRGYVWVDLGLRSVARALIGVGDLHPLAGMAAGFHAVAVAADVDDGGAVRPQQRDPRVPLRNAVQRLLDPLDLARMMPHVIMVFPLLHPHAR